LRVVQGFHSLSTTAPTTAPTILLQATMRNNPLDFNTHLKKFQKSFSASLGARLASMNWPTILVSSGLSDTWHGREVKRDLDFWGWVLEPCFERWTPANSLLPQCDRVRIFWSWDLGFMLGLIRLKLAQNSISLYYKYWISYTISPWWESSNFANTARAISAD
jgi:hypothetical protein